MFFENKILYSMISLELRPIKPLYLNIRFYHMPSLSHNKPIHFQGSILRPQILSWATEHKHCHGSISLVRSYENSHFFKVFVEYSISHLSVWISVTDCKFKYNLKRLGLTVNMEFTCWCYQLSVPFYSVLKATSILSFLASSSRWSHVQYVISSCFFQI